MLWLSLSCHSESTRAHYLHQPRLALSSSPNLLFSAGDGDPSLSDVYDSMSPPLTREEWHIHDPSHVLETDGILMIAVTGKAQENGYK